MIPVVSLLLSCSTDAAQDTAERVDRPRPPLLIDADGDGYSPPEDCDDTRPEVNPSPYNHDPPPVIGEPITDWDWNCTGLYDGEHSRTLAPLGWEIQPVGDADLDGTDDFSAVAQTKYYYTAEYALSGRFGPDGSPFSPWEVHANDGRGILSSTFVDDFTGDGKPEFVAAGGGGLFATDGAVLVARPSFGPQLDLGWVEVSFPRGTEEGNELWYHVVRLGDLDDDGAEELLLGDRGEGDILACAILTPAALFSGEQTEPRSWVDIGKRFDKLDVDGDGLTDLLTEEAVYLGADYALPGVYEIDAAWTLPAPADSGVECGARNGSDLDGDGRDDLLRGCQDAGPGWLSLLSVDPAESGGATELGRIEGVASGDSEEVGTEYIGVGDGDGDGLGDVVVQGVTAEYTHTVLFSGARVRGAVPLSKGEQPSSVWCGAEQMMMADVSGDGRLDLVCPPYVHYNEHLFVW